MYDKFQKNELKLTLMYLIYFTRLTALLSESKLPFVFIAR